MGRHPEKGATHLADRVSSLLEVIDQRERATRFVLEARASDEQHRLLARRYLHSLDAHREILERCGADDDAYERPEVRLIVESLGLVPTT